MGTVSEFAQPFGSLFHPEYKYFIEIYEFKYSISKEKRRKECSQHDREHQKEKRRKETKPQRLLFLFLALAPLRTSQYLINFV